MESTVDRTGAIRNIPVLAPPLSSTPRLHVHDALFVLHPGYGDASNVLFSLPCVDLIHSPTSPSRSHGVHHRTVLVAAQIVANNAFHGWLALDRQGAQRVSTPLDDVLTGAKYFFIVPDDDLYPVVPSFQDWRFPHDDLPGCWPVVGRAEIVQAAHCVITRFPWSLDRAHIVPAAQTSWFDRNGMSRYGTGVCPNIDDDINRLWLRRDLHTSTFDAFWFTFVPKPAIADADGDSSTATTSAAQIYTLHVLVADHPLFPQLYHDIQLPHLRGVAREYLFARFAQAVFIRVKPFISAKKRRRIARFVANDDKEEVVREELDGDTLFQRYSAGRTRSASPTKRKRGGEDTPISTTLQDEDWSLSVTDSDVDVDNGSRGRKRRRTWEGDPADEITYRPVSPYSVN